MLADRPSSVDQGNVPGQIDRTWFNDNMPYGMCKNGQLESIQIALSWLTIDRPKYVYQ
jgi:hypothetical protein